MKLWKWIKAALAPMPPCARCGEDWSAIGHQSWDPGWPSMPMGKEPVEHWYVDPRKERPNDDQDQ